MKDTNGFTMYRMGFYHITDTRCNCDAISLMSPSEVHQGKQFYNYNQIGHRNIMNGVFVPNQQTRSNLFKDR